MCALLVRKEGGRPAGSGKLKSKRSSVPADSVVRPMLSRLGVVSAMSVSVACAVWWCVCVLPLLSRVVVV